MSTRLGAQGLGAEPGRQYVEANGAPDFVRALLDERFTHVRGWETLDRSGVFG